MADTIREEIMQHVQTTLQNITTANGYATTLHGVERVLQSGQSTVSPMAYVWEGRDEVEAEGPYNFYSRSFTVGVVLVLRQDDTDTRSASQAMNSVIGDVQKALQVDPTRNGWAIDTKELGIDPISYQDGIPQLVTTMEYQIRYRHPYNNPYVKV